MWQVATGLKRLPHSPPPSWGNWTTQSRRRRKKRKSPHRQAPPETIRRRPAPTTDNTRVLPSSTEMSRQTHITREFPPCSAQPKHLFKLTRPNLYSQSNFLFSKPDQTNEDLPGGINRAITVVNWLLASRLSSGYTKRERERKKRPMC